MTPSALGLGTQSRLRDRGGVPPAEKKVRTNSLAWLNMVVPKPAPRRWPLSTSARRGSTSTSCWYTSSGTSINACCMAGPLHRVRKSIQAWAAPTPPFSSISSLIRISSFQCFSSYKRSDISGVITRNCDSTIWAEVSGFPSGPRDRKGRPKYFAAWASISFHTFWAAVSFSGCAIFPSAWKVGDV